MVRYKQTHSFDIKRAEPEVESSGRATVVRCFDSRGNAVQLHMSRSALEKLLSLAKRELKRVPTPARGHSHQIPPVTER